jgi:hypothetical protein
MEGRRRETFLVEGCPVSQEVLDDVRAIGAEFGVEWPF